MEKIRIKNNRKNIFFVIIGRIATYFIIWGLLIQTNVKIIDFIINNCITTL